MPPEIKAIRQCQKDLRDEDRGYTDSCAEALNVIEKLYEGYEIPANQINHAIKYIDNPMMWSALERANSQSASALKDYIDDPDGTIQTNLKKLTERYAQEAEEEAVARHEALVAMKELREGQIQELQKRREYELAFERYVKQKYIMESEYGPLPSKDWSGDDSTTRLLKNHIEQMLEAGATPEAFDSQMASIIKSDRYLLALLKRSQDYRAYRSLQNMKRLRKEFARFQAENKDFPEVTISKYHGGDYSISERLDDGIAGEKKPYPEPSDDALQANNDRRKRILDDRIASLENEIDGVNIQIDRQQQSIDDAEEAIQRIKDKKDWQESHSAREQIDRY